MKRRIGAFFETKEKERTFRNARLSMGCKKDVFAVFAYEFEPSHSKLIMRYLVVECRNIKFFSLKVKRKTTYGRNKWDKNAPTTHSEIKRLSFGIDRTIFSGL